MKDSPFNIMTNKKYKSISISNLIINPDNDRFESVENEKQAIDIYNPQIEMFARFKMKSSFHKTKRII